MTNYKIEKRNEYAKELRENQSQNKNHFLLQDQWFVLHEDIIPLWQLLKDEHRNGGGYRDLADCYS